MASSLRDRFNDFVASKGRTVTDQMARVVDTVLDYTGTFDHEDVVVALKEKASRPTVYRTLAKMVEAGVLQQVRFNDREVFVVTADG